MKKIILLFSFSEKKGSVGPVKLLFKLVSPKGKKNIYTHSMPTSLKGKQVKVVTKQRGKIRITK